MKFRKSICIAALAASLTAVGAFAQDHRDDQDHHDNHAYVRHDEWRKGAKINHDDWQRGEAVDWHAHHLRQPPRGYEWREVDGNYVLAAVATGLIASAIVASKAH